MSPAYLAQILTFSGYIIGLGAVTVIDIHGYLARYSHYWTRATISAHKVTKPLIWLGTTLALVGSLLTAYLQNFSPQNLLHLAILFILILNGCFLTFVVSPFLLKQEAEGRAEELLPKHLQIKITLSFVVSFLGWWGSLLLYLSFPALK